MGHVWWQQQVVSCMGVQHTSTGVLYMGTGDIRLAFWTWEIGVGEIDVNLNV